MKVRKLVTDIYAKKIGFIGCGQMGQAILEGCIEVMKKQDKNVEKAKESIFIYEPSTNIRKRLESRGFKNICSNEVEVVENTKIIFNCVKPWILPETLTKTINTIKQDSLMISIAAGIDIEFMEEIYRTNYIEKALKKDPSLDIEELREHDILMPKLARVMTNHLCSIKQTGSVYSMNKNCDHNDEEIVNFLFNDLGLIKKIDENLMHAYTGLTGSGPAFVYYFIESLVDSALKNGIDVESARQFAVQTVLGAAMFLDNNNDSPNMVKYIVTTPKGTTITGLNKLNEHRFKYSVDQAISAAANKSLEVEQNNKLKIEQIYKRLENFQKKELKKNNKI